MKPTTSIPKPFSRPSIDLDSPKREWLKVWAELLKAGDTVADVGLLDKVEKSEDFVSLHGPMVTVIAKPKDLFLAFVEATKVG